MDLGMRQSIKVEQSRSEITCDDAENFNVQVAEIMGAKL